MQEVTRGAAWVLVALLVAGCASSDTPGDTKPALQLPGIPGLGSEKRPLVADLKPGPYERSRLAIGEEKDLAQQRGEGFGFVPGASLNAYVTRIRSRLLTASGVTGVPGRAVILANPAFAAYSTPDGNAYVAMGWLPFLTDEDEMAAIIAHEVSHVLLTHHSSDIVVGVRKRAQSLHELGLAARTAVDKKPAVKGDQEALQISHLVAEASDKLAMPAWNRRQERAADLLGVDLLVRAGYTPGAMVSMLEKLRAWEQKTRESDDAFWERVRLSAANDIGATFKMTLDRFIAELSVSHPDTGQRIEDVAGYLDRHYGDRPLPAATTASWNNLRAAPDVRETMRNYDLAFSARKLLDRRKAREAYTYAQAAAAGRTATHAYPNWILARSAMANGRSSEAAAALDRAIKANEPIRAVYEEIITVNEQRGNLDVALGWTDKATTTFGETDRWLPTKIRLLRKSGRVDEANALTLKCTVDAPDWRRLCQEANQTPAGRSRRSG
jgi:Zn-dependent protease with chaperone function